MKRLCFVIIDGLGDIPIPELGGKTPLEAAYTPVLDKMADEGQTGIVYPVRGMAPQSDGAIITLFGYNPNLFTGRGPLEALGAGIDIGENDMALRTNFSTISGENVWSAVVEDRRVGRTLTTEESFELGDEINKKIKLTNEFIFKPTIEHRGILAVRNVKSAEVSNTDGAYKLVGKIGVVGQGGIARSEGDRKSSSIVNSFVEQSYDVLKKSEVNKKRIGDGLMPANVILTRDAGKGLPNCIPMEKKTGMKWGAVVGMPLEKGIAMATGMKVLDFDYPAIRGTDIYDHLHESLTAEITYSKIYLLREEYDAYWLHFKEIDIPGHDGNFKEKIKMLETLDKKFFSWLSDQDFVTIVTADHSTPCIIKNHSADPVPLLIHGLGKDSSKSFSEKECRNGVAGEVEGSELMDKIKVMMQTG